jgi:hypothetical protein
MRLFFRENGEVWSSAKSHETMKKHYVIGSTVPTMINITISVEL